MAVAAELRTKVVHGDKQNVRFAFVGGKDG
jgi:hypothetical protein